MVHVVVAEVWLDSTPYTQTRLSIDLMTNVKGEALRSLAPETGAYYNEVSIIVTAHYRQIPPKARLIVSRLMISNQTGNNRSGAQTMIS